MKPSKADKDRDNTRLPMTLRTINDYEFDVNLITRFNKTDSRKTKYCRECIRAVISVLMEGDCTKLGFAWVTNFKFSIFQKDVLDEIVPILMVLKKIAMTPRENTSLWIVMARRFVNMKVQRGIMNPATMPSVYAPKKEDTSMRKTAEENNEMTDQRFGEGDHNGDMFTLQSPSPSQNGSLYRPGCLSRL